MKINGSPAEANVQEGVSEPVVGRSSHDSKTNDSQDHPSHCDQASLTVSIRDVDETDKGSGSNNNWSL